MFPTDRLLLVVLLASTDSIHTDKYIASSIDSQIAAFATVYDYVFTKSTYIHHKRSVLRRQSRERNRNTKRSVYCQYGKYSLTFPALTLPHRQTILYFSLTKGQCSKRSTILSVLAVN